MHDYGTERHSGRARPRGGPAPQFPLRMAYPYAFPITRRTSGARVSRTGRGRKKRKRYSPGRSQCQLEADTVGPEERGSAHQHSRVDGCGVPSGRRGGGDGKSHSVWTCGWRLACRAYRVRPAVTPRDVVWLNERALG